MFARPLLAALLLAAVAGCRAAPPAPTGPGPGDLTGTRWQLARWQESDGALRPIPHGSDPITLQFGESGGRKTLAGFAGCNQFNGPYEMAGDRLAAEDVVATKRACLTPQRNQLETAFLAALDEGVTVTRETDDGAPALRLKTKSGETLTFRAT
ncbi:MAG TPA: META domain-containing protein [Alphaproteobacteria bacterium]